MTLRRLFTHWGTATGLFLLAFVLIAALGAQWIIPYDPLRMSVGPRLTPPSAAHWFGTDELGRDLFSRVLTGTRLSLGIGLVAVAIGLSVGVLFGLVIAVCGPRLKTALLRVVDVLYSFPDTLIALALVAFMGPGVNNATIAIAISLIPFYARITYGLAAVEHAKPYVEAAWISGARAHRVMAVQITPNILQSLIVVGSIGFSSAILSAAGLSFLGLGVQPPNADWGGIVRDNKDGIVYGIAAALVPAFAIATLAISVNLVADWVLTRTTSLKGGRGG